MNENLEEIINRTKTSVEIADDLWRDVIVFAAKKGLKLFQVLDAALKKYIELEEQNEKK